MKKNILIITDSYPPEIRSSALLIKELAEALRHRGHEVSVVTSYPSSNLDKNDKKDFLEDAVENGIKVLRVRIISHHNVNFITKGISWLLMPFLFYRIIRKNIKGKIDVAIVHSPPLTLTIATYLVKKYYKARYVLNLQDFFPQNAIDLGVLRNKFIIRFFQAMERWAYKTSDVIITPSNEHKNYLMEKRNVANDKIIVVPHWIDLEPFEKIKKTGEYRNSLGLNNKIIFHFGGVLGPSQGVDLLIRLAERVADKKDIHFVIAGEGTEKTKLEKMVEEKKLVNVSFRPYEAKDKYTLFLKDMDVGILTLTSKNTTPAVPAKIMFYLASRLPILGFLHVKSEAHLIIKKAQCGYSAIYEDEDVCYEVLMRMYYERAQLLKFGQNGFVYAQKHFTPEVCVLEWEKAL